MPSFVRRVVLVAVLAGALGCIAATSAFGYGKATWQTAFTGTFVFPSSGVGLGFWGWCDFAGGVTSGPDADCQVAEYLHLPSGAGWTCQLSIDGSWTQGPEIFDPTSITFHLTGGLVVHGHLTQAQADTCVGFFVFGDAIPYPSRSFTDVDTFIPAAPGHYAIPPSVLFGPDVVGEFNFTVALNPTA
jgi:hypothetical protein